MTLLSWKSVPDLRFITPTKKTLKRSFSWECFGSIEKHELFAHRGCCNILTAPVQYCNMVMLRDLIERQQTLPEFEPEYAASIQSLYSTRSEWWPGIFEYPDFSISPMQQLMHSVLRGPFRIWLRENVFISRTLEEFARGTFCPTAAFPSLPRVGDGFGSLFQNLDSTDPQVVKRRIVRYRVCINLLRHYYRVCVKPKGSCPAEEDA